MLRFPDVTREAAERFSPAVIANYIYDLAKAYNHFYHDNLIADASNSEVSCFRLKCSATCAEIIRIGTKLLGIGVPERM